MPERRPSPLAIGAAALAVALFAGGLYRATLLPGLDLGDTGSFQATVGSRAITPRDGYPLYFALGNAVVWTTGIEPARALNLLSAGEAAIAAALMVYLATELSGSVLAAVAAALLFVGSYTFWSQAIIAEVYALHILFVTLTTWLLLRWAERPTLGRLALFFGAYALGFGNHLSMVLLAPGFVAFLFVAAPRSWRTMLSPRVLGLAAIIALGGALQYAWNLRALWQSAFPPAGLAEALRMFWFDVTKEDWRQTMVMRVPASMMADRLSMYAFDARQQFGIPGLALSALGCVHLCGTAWRRGLLLVGLYTVNWTFAFTYNVGDTHVFYLPSHLILALGFASGLVFVADLARRAAAAPQVGRRSVASALLLLGVGYSAGRIYRDYPALDRSEDRRPSALVEGLVAGLDGRRSIFLADLNWQIENGLAYVVKVSRPAVVSARMPDVLLHLPALVRDNAAIGREVAVSERARDEAVAAYGPLLPVSQDPRVGAPALLDLARTLPKGSRYALLVLAPTRGFTLDDDALDRSVRLLTASGDARLPEGDYRMMVGLTGRQPALAEGGRRPFRRVVDLDGTSVEVRMEAWLSMDTIRRMGFGHVIAARRHVLIAERGLSFVAFDERGDPIRSTYEASLYAPQPRYLLSFRQSLPSP